MSRAKSQGVFSLIKSMTKNEKRYFKVMMSRSGSSEDKKVLMLFDEMNLMEEYNEALLLKKIPLLKSSQLSNTKAYLTEKILQSIRQFNISKLTDIQIREQLDFAEILFERRLLGQGLNCLKKAKKLAEANENLELLLEAIRLEKNFLLESIDGDNITMVDDIIAQIRRINAQINNINIFSHLTLKLDYHFAKIGGVRSEKDYLEVKKVFDGQLPEVKEEDLSVIEKIYLYNLYIGYYFYILEYVQGYDYARKLVTIFDNSPELVKNKLEIYLKSLNHLLNATFRLFKYDEFVEAFDKLRYIGNSDEVYLHENMRIRWKKYWYNHEINSFFMQGEFTKGLEYLCNDCKIEEFLHEIDNHGKLVLYYKIACMHFGAGDFNQAVKWLNRIINEPNPSIREDLHCFARILHLISHYELGNDDIISYYIVSTYRFLLKKDDLHLFQKYIIKFLKNLDKGVDSRELLQMFRELKGNLLPLMNSHFEQRAFYYFDIISWLESKIEQLPVEEVVKRKFRVLYPERAGWDADSRSA